MKNMWAVFAVLSAVFAALTSILAKVGIKDVDSNLATAIRTYGFYHQCAIGNHEYWQKKLDISYFVRSCNRCFVALLLQSNTNRRGFKSCAY